MKHFKKFTTKSKSNATRNAAFIVCNKPGLSAQYKAANAGNYSKKIKKSSPPQIAISTVFSETEFDDVDSERNSLQSFGFHFDDVDLRRLSLSVDENLFDIDETLPRYRSKYFDEYLNARKRRVINPLSSFVPKPNRPNRPNVNQSFTDTVSTTRTRASIPTELNHISSRQTVLRKNASTSWRVAGTQTQMAEATEPQTKLHAHLQTSHGTGHSYAPLPPPPRNQSKPQWVAPTVERNMSKHKRTDITPKITQRSAGATIEKRDSAVHRKSKSEQQQITTKIGSHLNEIIESPKETIQTIGTVTAVEPKVDHSFPRSNLFKERPFSWTIPMSDASTKKASKVPLRFQKRKAMASKKKANWRR